MANFNYNCNPQSNGNPDPQQEPDRSGVSVNFRLSETLIAGCLSGLISFGSGYAVANNQNHNQNINNCAPNVIQPLPGQQAPGEVKKRS